MRRIPDIRVLSALDDMYRLMAMPFGWVTYLITTRVLRRPYFGVWLASAQGNPLRHPLIADAVVKCAKARRAEGLDGEFRALEIGAYAGASTIEFATALRTAQIAPYLMYSVDPWDAYLDAINNPRIHYRMMNRDLANGNVLRLFVRNIRAAMVSDVCRQIRGRSEEMLPLLQGQQFDFVYVDGDHAPAAVTRDLNEAQRLLRPGGYLCGDDLEMQLHELDPEFVTKHADEDVALDPQSGRIFHPGVAIAVEQFFGRPVSSYQGFWVVRWTGEKYEDVVLSLNGVA